MQCRVLEITWVLQSANVDFDPGYNANWLHDLEQYVATLSLGYSLKMEFLQSGLNEITGESIGSAPTCQRCSHLTLLLMLLT